MLQTSPWSVPPRKKIDQLLAINPLGIGEARTAKIRLLVEPPLGIYYEVRTADRIVQVRAIWRWPSQAP